MTKVEIPVSNLKLSEELQKEADEWEKSIPAEVHRRMWEGPENGPECSGVFAGEQEKQNDGT